MSITDQYKKLQIKHLAGRLGLHPFDVVRVMAARGPLPADLAYEEPEQERIRSESGLEVWWVPGKPLEADFIRARGVLRSMVRELLSRKVVGNQATRADNLWRGLEDEDERTARRAVNLLLQEQYLKTVSSRLGIRVAVPPDKVAALEKIAAREVSLGRIRIAPVTGAAAQVEQQVGLVTLHLADGRIECRRVDGVEIDVLRDQERVQLLVEGGVGLRYHTDPEKAPGLAAKDHGERDDQRQRKQEIEDKRRAIAQELEVTRGPDRQKATEIHVRSSRPVSSRNRSSRFRGRIFRCFSGTPRSSRARSACSTSAVEISIRSPASSNGIGNPAGCLLSTLIYALRDRGLQRGLATLCLGGGEAVALAVEVEE